jgi:NAD(P)-dependent dehydrogenase (short-subunit alcohol dehydrogenase family)
LPRTVVITGGASGIGEVISNAFILTGDNVIILSRNISKFYNFLSKNYAYKNQIFHYELDICLYDNVVSTFKEIHSTHGKIDVLINNAGILGPVGRFDQIDMDEILYNLNVNLCGSMNTMHAALKSMKERSFGKIINISGGGAVKPLPSLSAYSASKTALVRLTETLAIEYQQYNIHIYSIAPGFIVTGIHDPLFEKGVNLNAGLSEEFKTRITKGGDDPQLTANLCLFLSSEKSNHLSGKIISAIHDDWKSLESLPPLSPLYTLRRVDNDIIFYKN